MKADERARKVEAAMRLTWDSLRSHLKYTYANRLPQKETKVWHKKCVKEYSEIIKLLSELY